MVGGVTLEEAKEVAEFNKKGGVTVLLGGTHLLNSKTYDNFEIDK